jgi:hypothetical protein
MYGGSSKRPSRYRGSGLLSSLTGAASTVVNKAIDLLPFEFHLPGYQYCGPGTNLAERLRRGDQGINKLDAACKQHDIAYAKYSDNESRKVADRTLVERAWERVKAPDSSLKEKADAWVVTNIMKAKSKLGSGRKQTKKRQRSTNTRKNKKCVKNRKKSANKKGKGLRLKPYAGSGMCKKKQRCKK